MRSEIIKRPIAGIQNLDSKPRSLQPWMISAAVIGRIRKMWVYRSLHYAARTHRANEWNHKSGNAPHGTAKTGPDGLSTLRDSLLALLGTATPILRTFLSSSTAPK